ncbi:MAG: ATP-dependent helicase [Eubacteriales bacterium]
MELKSRYNKAKRALFDKAYSFLNEPQREAVFTVNNPLLVLAGAGSGKTTVLVNRIAYIIKYGNAYYGDFVPEGTSEEDVERLENALSLSPAEISDILPEFIYQPCPPYAVLAITFTNKAANEIKSRLVSVLGDADVAKDIWAGTFHSICVRILRRYGSLVGYGDNFTIYDTEDSKRSVAAVMKDLKIDEKALPIKTVMNQISRAKDKLMGPEEYERQNAADFRLSRIAKIYAAYQDSLLRSNSMDFDDIIMKTVELLRNHEDVRTYYQNKFKYVCVDEFQDTNEAQFALTVLLSGHYRNLMVVGDDDQSIYGFRGAEVKIILSFDKFFSDTRTIRLEQITFDDKTMKELEKFDSTNHNNSTTKILRLEQNYRSTQNILDAANAVISHNRSRHEKILWTANGAGDKIVLHLCDDQNAEARYIVTKINDSVSRGENKFRDFAILYRTNAQSNTIERTFAKSGMPYRMLGGTRFNDRKEIRDIVAYLQLINNHSDGERLLRIINEPKRKIGERTIEGIREIAAEKNTTLFEVIRNADKYVALQRSSDTLLGFAALIERLTQILADGCPLDAFVNRVLDMSGYRQMLIDAGEEEKERLENLEEFISGVIEYQSNNEEPTLTGFLEENMLVSDVDKYDENADACVMMTIHSAKGLEFPVVFLPGMEDGLFPGMQTLTAGEAEIEEERRLAYVAITRAKNRLYILHTKNRMIYGRTSYNPVSRFVEEIPKELICDDTPRQGFTSSPDKPKVYYSAVGTQSSQKTASSGIGDTVTIGKKLFVPQGGAAKEIFKEGDRVSHITFGEGEVISVKPMGSDILYEIMFDKVGTKKLMATYARLKKVL